MTKKHEKNNPTANKQLTNHTLYPSITLTCNHPTLTNVFVLLLQCPGTIHPSPDQRHDQMIRFTSAAYIKHKRRSRSHVVRSSIQRIHVYASGDYLCCYYLTRPESCNKEWHSKRSRPPMKALHDEKKTLSKKQNFHRHNRILVLNKSSRSMISVTKHPLFH